MEKDVYHVTYSWDTHGYFHFAFHATYNLHVSDNSSHFLTAGRAIYKSSGTFIMELPCLETILGYISGSTQWVGYELHNGAIKIVLLSKMPIGIGGHMGATWDKFPRFFQPPPTKKSCIWPYFIRLLRVIVATNVHLSGDAGGAHMCFHAKNFNS